MSLTIQNDTFLLSIGALEIVLKTCSWTNAATNYDAAVDAFCASENFI
jgi:hypothetical protein